MLVHLFRNQKNYTLNQQNHLLNMLNYFISNPVTMLAEKVAQIYIYKISSISLF